VGKKVTKMKNGVLSPQKCCTHQLRVIEFDDFDFGNSLNLALDLMKYIFNGNHNFYSKVI
jgi:hypothetical protein